MTRQPAESPTKRSNKQIEDSPRRMKITRRQSAAVMVDSSGQSMRHLLGAKQRASFDNGGNKYNFPRSSFDTVRPVTGPNGNGSGNGEPRVSFDDKTSKAGHGHGYGHDKPRPRSSLESKVLRGLRSRESLVTNASVNRGPVLQRSTSGLAFEESDKENHREVGEMF